MTDEPTITLDDVYSVVFTAGRMIGQGQMAGRITDETTVLLEAVSTILANADEIARTDPVLGRFLREKALAAMHEDPDQTVDGTATEEQIQPAQIPQDDEARLRLEADRLNRIMEDVWATGDAKAEAHRRLNEIDRILRED